MQLVTSPKLDSLHLHYSVRKQSCVTEGGGLACAERSLFFSSNSSFVCYINTFLLHEFLVLLLHSPAVYYGLLINGLPHHQFISGVASSLSPSVLV